MGSGSSACSGGIMAITEDIPMTDPKPALTRRAFLETAAGVTLAGTLLPRVWAAEIKNGIPYRTLGNTGENVSVSASADITLAGRRRAGEHPDYSYCARRRHQFSRQLLGL